MNNIPAEPTPDKKIDDEPQVALQKVFKNVQLNFNCLEKCVGFCKEVLSECCEKLEELRSQMTELESMMKETTKNDTQKSLDSCERIQERNHLNEISARDIIEDVTVSEREKPDKTINSHEAVHNGNQRKKLKTNLENDEISQFQAANYECVPGPSQEATRNREENHSYSQEKETEDEILKFDIKKEMEDDIIETALQNTEGVLSAEELKSFLLLSNEVEDPVQLAEISFTANIEALCTQLMNFNFLLKVENDTMKKRFPSLNRDLEVKVRSLIDAFQAQVGESQAEPLGENSFMRFRREHPRRCSLAKMRHFVM